MDWVIAPGFTLRNLFALNWSALDSGLSTLGNRLIGVIFIVAGHMYKTDFGLGVGYRGISPTEPVQLMALPGRYGSDTCS